MGFKEKKLIFFFFLNLVNGFNKIKILQHNQCLFRYAWIFSFSIRIPKKRNSIETIIFSMLLNSHNFLYLLFQQIRNSFLLFTKRWNKSSLSFIFNDRNEFNLLLLRYCIEIERKKNSLHFNVKREAFYIQTILKRDFSLSFWRKESRGGALRKTQMCCDLPERCIVCRLSMIP